jgi:dienelactone hydrolase
VGAILVVAVVAAVQPLRAPLQGLALVVRAANPAGAARSAAQLMTVDVNETPALIPTEGQPLRARIYAPHPAPRLAVLLITGIHPAGIDEPRLMRLSRELARANVTVVTPEIPELMAFRIAPVVTDRIEEAASWMAANLRLAGGGTIGLIGVSVSGGLAVVAAGRPSLRGRVRFVLSLGGHDDLGRVLEFLCGRDGGRQRPHDYGVAVALLNVADRLVPDGQVEALREAVRRFLAVSYLARFDRTAAMREFDALSIDARELPEPSATLLSALVARDVPRLAPLLRPHLRTYAEQAALSPARSPLPSSPVYLLHGRGDAVIPASESRYLADRLHGRAPVRLLVTSVISHADADQPAQVLDVVRLAWFWGGLLNER